MLDGTVRKNIKIGMLVDIVKKKDQPTGNLTRGYVKRLLTNSPNHHRGIKVELINGDIGRCQRILTKDDIRLENFKFYNQFFFLNKIFSIWDSSQNHYLIIDHNNVSSGTLEKTSFLFDTFEDASAFIKGTKYDSKDYPIREINRRKSIFDNFCNIGTQFIRINKERKLSLDKLNEWENYFKNMR
ncbi:putative repeat protein (TIGR03833 family) [Paenibacillus sp. 1182]|uniref:YwbE family protein n=1 Tax=Paenibacillus sp. 1182 TaxID=2806565 RepID=UPI001AE60108|nr:YwbE family protein [Paenibacillus sp. 1182]MBP1308952.1 putative repeat protein (TIGR03833 family) [Paenibacillus sp. 1182]